MQSQAFLNVQARRVSASGLQERAEKAEAKVRRLQAQSQLADQVNLLREDVKDVYQLIRQLVTIMHNNQLDPRFTAEQLAALKAGRGLPS